MSFEPQKFFIGLMDFFSILLPGALLSYAIRDRIGEQALGLRLADMGESEGWLVFFFSSYLLGHFIFLLGSWFDEFYDLARRRTQTQRLKELARWGTLHPKWKRALLWLVFKQEKDKALDRVLAIKRKQLDRLQAADAVNAFQWAKLRLALEKPEVLATVQRFEADSKFFRSVVVVLFVLPFAATSAQRHALAPYWIVFVLLAFWRYMEQRHKASSQAYWSVIALEGQAATGDVPARPRRADGLTHAGGVVYRESRRRGRAPGEVEWLLVESKADADTLVLPKGHIEAREDARLAAVREVREETGVFGAIQETLTVSTYRPEGADADVKVQFFLMKALEQWRPSDPLRRSQWHPLKTAIEKVSHDENKQLLEAADATRQSLPPSSPRR